MTEIPSRSWIEVSRRRIVENFRSILRAAAGVEVMPVVKSDAYRHGALEVSRVLVAEGARWLAVSNAEEGAALREAGIPARIVVMAGILPAEEDALTDYDLTPVAHSLDDIARFDRLAEARRRPVIYHLKVDSGMGRLGTLASTEEIAAAVRSARHARLEGLMTHFACAADYTSAQTDEQMGTFEALLEALGAGGVTPACVHMAGTIALAYGRRRAWHTLVRPGHAVYGYVSPVRGSAVESILDVRPALSWKASLVAVKQVPAGTRIGYGAMYSTPAPMRIGILGAGYADGLPHRLSNRGKVIAGGRLVSILGAVSMDLTTIDLTACPELQPGDAVTLIGSEGGVSLDAQQMARTAGTISYDVLCGISARVRRVYVD